MIQRIKYEGWQSSIKKEEGHNILHFTDDNGNDWYDVWGTFKSNNLWAVAINTDGSIHWVDNDVEGFYSPPLGGVILGYVTLPVPLEDLKNQLYVYDNGAFKRRPEPQEEPERTKEDILKDLIALQEELKNLK